MVQDESVINPFIQLVHPKKNNIYRTFYEEEMEALFKTVDKDLKRIKRSCYFGAFICYWYQGIRVSKYQRARFGYEFTRC